VFPCGKSFPAFLGKFMFFFPNAEYREIGAK
jgi:hypothetical protein